MIYRSRIEGAFCSKRGCAIGSPMCDKCPCNFGAKIKQESFDDMWGGNVTIDVYYVKCASWMGFGLAKCVKDFIGD